MCNIVPDVIDLVQHLNVYNNTPQAYKPSRCPNCNHSTLWWHGVYFRKSDREQETPDRVVPIPRSFCPNCKKTSSSLPECIPRKRWYLWGMQQSVLLDLLSGMSFRALAKKHLPSRQTISAWYQSLRQNHLLYAYVLKARFPILSHSLNFSDFWKTLLGKINLSKVYFFLNHDGLIVP